MTEGVINMPIASIDLVVDSPLVHPGTSIFAEVSIKNIGNSAIQITTEPYTYANRFQIAKRGEEEDAEIVSAKDALISRMTDDLPRRQRAPITLQPNNENTDREDIASYFSESLKPGNWSIRATRELVSKEVLTSEWRQVIVSPWQLSLAALRFDPDGSHWQSSMINKERDGSYKLWVKYSDGKHPASGTYQNWTETLSANSPGAPALEKATSIAFAHLFSSSSDEWMLIKEGSSLRGLKSSGVVTEVCYGSLKSGEDLKLLESGIFLDKGERSLFALMGVNPSGTRIQFFKAGDGKVVAAGSVDLAATIPGNFAHCWVQRGDRFRLILAFGTRAQSGRTGIDYWTQELEWDPNTLTVNAGVATRQWTDAREAIALNFDPAHSYLEATPPLALLVPSKNSRSLDLIQVVSGNAPQKRSITLKPGMKPEKSALCTRSDGQWAVVLVSRNGVFFQLPGNDSWTLLSQEKNPVQLLRAARVVGGEMWAAWIVDERGMKWAKIGTGR